MSKEKRLVKRKRKEQWKEELPSYYFNVERKSQSGLAYKVLKHAPEKPAYFNQALLKFMRMLNASRASI